LGLNEGEYRDTLNAAALNIYFQVTYGITYYP